MTSKSIWKKVQNLLLDACTHSLCQNWGSSEHLLKTMLGLVSSDPQILPMEHLSSLSRRTMAVYDFVLTIVDLTKSARRIVILFHLSLTCLIHCRKPAHSQKSTSIMPTTLFTSQKVKNGKPPSALVMAHLSGWLCHLDSQMPPRPFNNS